MMVQGGRDCNQSKVCIRGTRGSRTAAGKNLGLECGLRDLFGAGVERGGYNRADMAERI